MTAAEIFLEKEDLKLSKEMTGYIIPYSCLIRMLNEFAVQKKELEGDCICKDRSSFYRDKEGNDMCYDCDKYIKEEEE